MTATAIAAISHIHGESVTWGLRSSQPFDNSETVTCDVKAALNGNAVPPGTSPVVQSAAVSFVPAAGAVAAHWLFSLTPVQTAAMGAGNYITDAKIVYASGAVDYPRPLGIVLAERVTA